MGPTGAGKSTVRVFSSFNICDFDRPQFIETATRQDGQTVGHGLQSRTAVIRTVRVMHPKTGRPIVFVDTPGFDDTYKSDTEILSIIADWLVRT
jgi:predicted GTPase